VKHFEAKKNRPVIVEKPEKVCAIVEDLSNLRERTSIL
jgi:hypothetical protein